MIKPGRNAIDPLNRTVRVIAVEGDWATVKLAGPYAATIRYPVSCLRPAAAGEG